MDAELLHVNLRTKKAPQPIIDFSLVASRTSAAVGGLLSDTEYADARRPAINGVAGGPAIPVAS